MEILKNPITKASIVKIDFHIYLKKKKKLNIRFYFFA